MADGSNLAKLEVEAPNLPAHPFPKENPKCDFDSETLPLYWCTPRNEITPDWADLTSRKGYLRLRGRESLSSYYRVSLLARRLTSMKAVATTKLEYTPTHYHHLAGLTCFYDAESHFSLYKTYDEVNKQEILAAYMFEQNLMTVIGSPIVLKENQPIWLRMEVQNDKLHLLYSNCGEKFETFGTPQDITILSDEHSKCGWFTGAFIGMFAQDTHTQSKWAEFDWFEYDV